MRLGKGASAGISDDYNTLKQAIPAISMGVFRDLKDHVFVPIIQTGLICQKKAPSSMPQRLSHAYNMSFYAGPAIPIGHTIIMQIEHFRALPTTTHVGHTTLQTGQTAQSSREALHVEIRRNLNPLRN